MIDIYTGPAHEYWNSTTPGEVDEVTAKHADHDVCFRRFAGPRAFVGQPS